MPKSPVEGCGLLVRKRRDFSILLWIAGCLLVAASSATTILMMPRFAEKDAYALFGGRNGRHDLPARRGAVKQSIPFQDPNAVLAVCAATIWIPTRVRYAAGDNSSPLVPRPHGTHLLFDDRPRRGCADASTCCF